MLRPQASLSSCKRLGNRSGILSLDRSLSCRPKAVAVQIGHRRRLLSDRNVGGKQSQEHTKTGFHGFDSAFADVVDFIGCF